MGRCILWAGASYGPVRLMGWCILWAGKYDMCTYSDLLITAMQNDSYFLKITTSQN